MEAGGELRFDWSWTLPATPETLWPLVSDTNRFNRDTGLPAVEDASGGRPLENARHHLRMRVKGVMLEWEELPFEWLRPWRFGVVRRYARGPLREMRVLATLEPVEGGRTRLRYRTAARPRGLLGSIAARVQIGLVSRWTFGRVFRRYADQARGPVPTGDSRSPARSSRLPSAARRGQKALVEAGVDGHLARRLVRHACLDDEMSVARIRPYALAALWNVPRRDALTACLRATRVGLLDLRWDVLCPRCRGSKREADTLRRLRTGLAHCDTCRIEFTPEFDQWVELSFAPSAALRAVRTSPFCVAGPQVTPHVVVQQLLDAGETREVSPLLELGRYGIRAVGVPGGPSFEVLEDGSDEGVATLGEEGWGAPDGPLRPTATLRLVNDTAVEHLFGIERASWADDTVTAAEVTAMAEFRDLFSSEVLAAGEFMSVGSLAVLFTDLKESTRLYRRVGDAPAFGRVMSHFEVLEEAVSRHEGTIVKTIGDAVMAVFTRAENGVAAALDAHRALARGAEPLVLKAGLHHGPCIAVTLNERLDYFGTTVNVAARLGALSEGGDLVVSHEVLDHPEVRALLERAGAATEPLEAELRGLDAPMRLWRITTQR